MRDIVETAARVFRRDGYDAGSLDDVAAELDLRKASLYHYVDSKAQLLYLVFDRAITLALERLDELAQLSDPRERLEALIAHQVRIIAEEPSLFAVFFDSRPRLADEFEDAIHSKERRYMRHYAEAVQGCIDAGVLPKINSRFGAQAILGMTSWVYKWVTPQDDTDELTADLVRLVLGEHDAG
jgi:AcrR family transcriptional regulator